MSWLLEHLIRAGHVTETGASRRAKVRICGRRLRHLGPRARCRDQVLLGLDDDRCALEVTADPTPLSPLGEALALIEGRRTLELRRLGAGWVLDQRLDTEIATHPAGTATRCDVVRQHQCGTTQPAGPLAATSTFPEVIPARAAHTAPPF